MEYLVGFLIGAVFIMLLWALNHDMLYRKEYRRLRKKQMQKNEPTYTYYKKGK